jgi:hypothetical protein
MDSEIDAAFRAILAEAGHVDVLVNNVWGGSSGGANDVPFTAQFTAQCRASHKATREIMRNCSAV